MMNNISQVTYGKYMSTEKIGFNADLKLKQGESFQGRIIKQDSESNKVIIRLTNGMEIEAEIQEDSNLKDGLLKFEVMDFKDNKLFIKLTGESSTVVKGETVNSSKDEIMNFILKEGLKKEDYNMLKQMVKYNIPLTRENITAVKSMIEFSNKMSNNPKEIQSFINAYLSSRNIVPNTSEANIASNRLYEFFEAFSKNSTEKVLLFLENDLTFSKENMDSYNKLFNSGNNIEKVIENVNYEIGKHISTEDEFVDKGMNKTLSDSNVSKEVFKEASKGEVIDKGQLDKSMLTTVMKDKEIITSQKAIEIINTLKGKSEGDINKESIKEVIIKQSGKDVSLSDNEVKNFSEILNKSVIKEKDVGIIRDIINNISPKQEVETKAIALNKIEERVFEISKNLSENVEKKSESTKEFIRNIVSALKEGNDSAEVLNIMKSNLNDLKLYNKISDQYYCLDVPVNTNDTEYPCKLIIKDDRKDGKSIDSSNFKVAVSVKTTKLGVVDALLNVRNKNIDVELKCEKRLMGIFEASKNNLKKIVESSGFTVNIKITEKKEELELSSCREFFNDNNIAALDITV